MCTAAKIWVWEKVILGRSHIKVSQMKAYVWKEVDTAMIYLELASETH